MPRRSEAYRSEASGQVTPEPQGLRLAPDELLSRCNFPAPSSELVCAVSGGADSLALLVLATTAGCRVTAVHVDHGLRCGSGAEAEVVAEIALRYGAAFRAEKVEVAPGRNLEAARGRPAGRSFRRGPPPATPWTTRRKPCS